MAQGNGLTGGNGKPRLVVIIPAYNEAPTVGRAIAEIPRSLPGVRRVEVVVVDDGSTDGTAEAARLAGADSVIRLKQNAGLTRAFATGLQAAIERGADIIVNTDADCQYDGREIPKLIAPILAGEADLVSGDRHIERLEHMTRSKQYGNRFGSWMLRIAADSPLRDASSGFRAFSRECALRLNPAIGNTYTHQTIIQAAHAGMVVREVPVTFRRSAREGGHSRLISSVGRHVLRSAVTILRTLTAYRPLSVLGFSGVLLLILAALVALIPLRDYIAGDTAGHIQSLIATVALAIVGVLLVLFGLLADAVSANRRATEELLYRIKKQQAGLVDAAAAEAETSIANARARRTSREMVGRGSGGGSTD